MTGWPVGFRVRPSADPDSADVEVTDTVTGRRFRWSPEALARYIRHGADWAPTGDGGGWATAVHADDDRRHLVAGWRHWQRRGWYPSDQYYVASRRWDYADTVDADEAIRTATLQRYLEVDGRPPEERPLDGLRTALGKPAEPTGDPVAQLMVSRRSGRAYVPKPVPVERLSGLLWYGLADVRARRHGTDHARPMSYLDSYGSAWDFHVCVYDVAGVEPGAYRYDIRTHELISVRPGNHRQAMTDVLQGMRSPATAAWTLGMVADFPRYQWRYRHEHGLRRLYLESGILGQQLVVLGSAYGLSTLVTPAQRDRPYLALHGLTEDRYAPVYTLTTGWSRGSAGVDFMDESRRTDLLARTDASGR
ncbi:SagB/ThcOx family dehydrogenase [Plantactinospora sp. B24E8]|uniref:SagB/ThcOx family dehydrogenase n=1 Tax=Plantactinospora sp. B24E8 TaxID=3153567 RepID=UPI00325F3F4C